MTTHLDAYQLILTLLSGLTFETTPVTIIRSGERQPDTGVYVQLTYLQAIESNTPLDGEDGITPYVIQLDVWAYEDEYAAAIVAQDVRQRLVADRRITRDPRPSIPDITDSGVWYRNTTDYTVTL